MFDESLALSRVGGNVEQLKRLAETFLEESQRLVAAIRDARTCNNGTKLMQAAHALRGAANVLGAQRVSQAALELESLCRAGKPFDTQGSSEALDREIEELARALSGVIHSGDTELACRMCRLNGQSVHTPSRTQGTRHTSRY